MLAKNCFMFMNLLRDTSNFVLFVADREVQRILLELLNQMDGFDQTVNVKVPKLINIHTFFTICAEN